MDRVALYHLYKGLLCHYGAVPRSEKKYEELIEKLLDIYLKKNGGYHELYF